MDPMEDKLQALLGNPQLMEQIQAMARSLGESGESSPQESPAPPAMDPALLQRLAALSRQGDITREQQALLQALGPYLARDRIAKLEKAMRAAKMAKFASSFLNSGGLQLLTGR